MGLQARIDAAAPYDVIDLGGAVEDVRAPIVIPPTVPGLQIVNGSLRFTRETGADRHRILTLDHAVGVSIHKVMFAATNGVNDPIAVALDGCLDCRVSRCTVGENFQAAVWGQGDHSENTHIRRVSGARDPTEYGGAYRYGSLIYGQGRLVTCTVVGCYTQGFAHLVLAGTDTSSPRRAVQWHISDCLAVKTEDSAIYLAGGDARIVNCRVFDAGKDAIKSRNGAGDYYGRCIVDRCVITRPGRVKYDGGVGIDMRCENAVLSNNTIVLGVTPASSPKRPGDLASRGTAGIVVRTAGHVIAGNTIIGSDAGISDSVGIAFKHGHTADVRGHSTHNIRHATTTED